MESQSRLLISLTGQLLWAHEVTKEVAYLVNRTTVVAHGVTKDAALLVNRTTVVAHGVTKEAAHLVNWTIVVGTRSQYGGC